jgi:hypothetical protein
MVDQIGRGRATFKGKHIDLVWNRAMQIEDNRIVGREERNTAGAKKMKELGITPGWLRKQQKIGDITYSNAELLGLYAASKNEKAKLAVILGNNLSEAKMNAFIEKLDAKGKAWADWIIEEYAKNKPRIWEASIDLTNTVPQTEENYTPLRYIMDILNQSTKDEILDEIATRKGLRKLYADKGFTISRLENIPKQFRRPVNLDLTGVWFDQVDKQENYIRNSKDIRMLQRIVNDPQWSQIVRERYGSEYVQSMREWANRVANPSYAAAQTLFDRMIGMVRHSTAVSLLVGNANVIAVQAPSFFLAFADVGPQLFFTSLQPWNYGKYLNRMNELSPQMRNRSVIREYEEFRNSNRNLYQKYKAKFGKYGLLPVFAMDKSIVTLVWNAQFEKSKRMGLTDIEAARESDNLVLRTQPAAAPKDLPRLFTHGEITKFFTLFGNQLNNIWGEITYDIPQRMLPAPERILQVEDAKLSKYSDKKAKNTRISRMTQSMMGVMGIMMSGTMIWMIRNRRLPKTKKDAKDIALTTFINPIPLIGPSLVQAMHGWEAGNIVPLKEVVDMGAGLFKKENWEKKIEGTLYSLNILLGGPAVLGRRIYRTIKTGRAEEMLGRKPRR